MNRNVNEIKNRLSLRLPQVESLNILSEITDKLGLKKDTDLVADLKIVNSIRPTCTDFERTFPSFCFSLATGVGKTRLMGAFISYLCIEKGIKNFFVMAPNLTVYDKLIDDFSNTSSPKYVFQGINRFVHSQPRIITGDNYEDVRHQITFESDVHINVFNISKINSETRAGKPARIKRITECLGDSYFNYLSNLEDLVLLMDESHHYRADRGMEVINELKPILGLELTATPQVERSGGAIKFKNVVYEYSLAVAIRDGFVKEPAIATRVDFDPSQYTDEDLDRIKLEDGIRIHEDTKVTLDIYARDNKVKYVKPFVLVVTKDVEHARKLKELIMSQSFFDGYYADKVMDIHSSQTGSEKDENIAKLLMLENPRNIIEIVIHVNMLKEGWDVTNLYTIIPLRTATSMTLREQTIGRGLRLPYGKRTGNDKVDKLTIVAHDKFQEIVDAANRPDSIVKRENIIVIDAQQVLQAKEVVTVSSNIEQKLIEDQKKIDKIVNPEEKHKAQTQIDIKKTIFDTIPELFKFDGQSAGAVTATPQTGIKVKNLNELTRSEIKEIAVEKIKEKLQNKPQAELFMADMIKEVEKAYDIYVSEYIQYSIEIPRIMIHQRVDLIKSGFKNFDLDVKNLNYQPVSEEILIKKLREQENDTIIIDGSGQGGITPDSLPNLIVSELINLPEIDYDRDSEILFELSNQAIKKFQTYLDEDKLMNMVQYNKKEIARFIYVQMMEHFYCERPKFDKLSVKPFTRIEEHNYSKFTKDSINDFKETIQPTSSIPNKIFGGFKKACHNLYKFDSKTEKDFSIILENDKAVIKWLRPARLQFHIYWDHNSKVYHPDFVVETKDTIYLIETKKEIDVQTVAVQEKALAAYQYCKNATEYTSKNSGKPWKYILIPHNVVLLNMSFETLAKSYEFKVQ